MQCNDTEVEALVKFITPCVHHSTLQPRVPFRGRRRWSRQGRAPGSRRTLAYTAPCGPPRTDRTHCKVIIIAKAFSKIERTQQHKIARYYTFADQAH